MMYHEVFKVGSNYTRKDISQLIREPKLDGWQEGLYYLPGTTLLFVTLDKTGTNVKSNDWFEEEYFHWDTQTRQDRDSPEIRAMQKNRSRFFFSAAYLRASVERHVRTLTVAASSGSTPSVASQPALLSELWTLSRTHVDLSPRYMPGNQRIWSR